ncbi:MAG: hybrid sensor histidine kinase/response regulator, partial [Rhizobacter sp.]|nr:hybrid sensor histidine kinase/response regulator [Rhizobacter sp.]
RHSQERATGVFLTMSKSCTDEAPHFLRGGGEMGALMRSHDWTSSGLGPPSAWPQSLKTAVRLLLGTQHPMFIWWGRRLIQFYNDAYRQSIGPERHPGALGQDGRMCWEEIWPIIGPQIDQVMAGQGATWHENALVPITRYGHREAVYWTYSYSPLDEPSAATGVGGVLVVCTETTSKVLAMQRLAAERESFAQLFEQAPTFMAVLRGDTHRIEMANPGYLRLIGHRDVVGRTVAEALPDAAAQGYVDLLDQVFQSGEAFSATGLRYAVQASVDGPVVERHLDFVYQPIRDAHGQVTGIFVEGVDVTDRTVSEVALRRSEGRLLALNADLERQVAERAHERGLFWQLTSDLLGVLNAAGHFEKSNPAWEVVLGWSEDEVQHTPIFLLVHPDDLEATRECLDWLTAGQPMLNFVNRYRCKDGTYRWLSWTGVPEEGKYYCSGRDITEEKQAQLALNRTQEALRQSQKMEAVGQLTGGIAHDFNNLLTSIGISLQMLERQLGSGKVDDVDRYIAMAQGAVKRAAALTQRLLAFSRRQTLDPKPCDLNRLIGGMEALIRQTMEPDVNVEVAGTGELWLTQVDASQLENTLLNLCINARDAMRPHGGRLTIETANQWLDDQAAMERELAPGPYVCLRVTDTGAGMSAETIARAFDPFFTTKPLGEGTGLGLSMVYGFVRQSGGQVRIDSQPDRGTTMSLYLPRHGGELQQDLLPDRPPTPDHGDGETVLVIEDEATIRTVIAEVLVDAGYRVVSADDGPAALRVLQSDTRIDLMVTDVGLPGGLNGRQVFDAGRVVRPLLKVLFITGYAENAAVGNGHLERTMDVMTKPFEVAALVHKVREMIKRRG